MTAPQTSAQKKRRTPLWLWAVIAAVVALVIYTAIPGGHPPNYNAESAAIGRLRTLMTYAVIYQATYENGFPPSVAALATGETASCNAAGLLDPSDPSSRELLEGRSSTYVFVYSAGPPVENPAEGCPTGMKSFTIVARPVKYGGVTRRSFFADESGVVRYTTEDRSPTKADSPIE